MKSNVLHLLLSTSLLATNIVPAAQPFPNLAIQVANAAIEERVPATDGSAASSTKKEEVTEPITGKTDSSESQNTENDASNSSSDEQKKQGVTDKAVENIKAATSKENSTSESRSLVTGTWGTSPYTFDDVTGTLTVNSGTLGQDEQQPWGKGEVAADKIQRIELVGTVIAPKDCGALFAGINNLRELTGNLDTSQVTDMSSMFQDCSSLTTLDLSGWNTSQVTKLYQTFYDCSSLTTLNLSGWDTSKVTTLQNTFYRCRSLTTLNVSGWDTSQVTNLNSTFKGCSNLTTLLGVSGWNTSQVTTLYSTFEGCSNLTTLDLSNWNTTKVTGDDDAFANCSSLNTLVLGAASLFDTSVSLLEGKWTGQSTQVSYSNTNEFLSQYNGSQPDTFVRTDVSTMKYWGTSPYTFDEAAGTLTVEAGTLAGYKESPWNKGDVKAEKVKKIVLQGNVVAPADCTYLFSANGAVQTKLINLTEIDGNLDTSQVTNMMSMFGGAAKLSTLDVSKWDTSQVTNMFSVFYGCRSLQSLDINDWNTSKVEAMYSMFYDCSSLTSLDLTKWNTGQVTNMGFMFCDCSALEELSVNGENWDTSKVTYMYSMFLRCHALSNLDISGWNTSQVIDMSNMFGDCDKLSVLALGQAFSFKINSLGGRANLPENKWIGLEKQVRYGTSVDFMDAYEASVADTYVWDRTAQLAVSVQNQDQKPMVIGNKSELLWTIAHSNQSAPGQMAKAITGKIHTAEVIDFDAELLVEKKDPFGIESVQMSIPVVFEGKSNEVATYSYQLPDLENGAQYKLSLSGTPWNNTTVSSDSDPTFEYEVSYEAEKLEVNGEDKVIRSNSKTSSNQKIENGNLEFSQVPSTLKFTTKKLSYDMNDQLISREDSDWNIGISDLRGTKAKSVADPSIARQDWELFATAETFKDSKNNEVEQDDLGIAYVGDDNVTHELSADSETSIKKHFVNGETPKNNHQHTLSWAEDEGFQAIVHNRYALKADETYKAEVTFELRSAP
ncbi:BspA family leucine-rich repeat surface protein [Erwinia sp. CPCC 100877]|nr:BspA family leucine-rich repeat surface protein [Erwinia sp. CPCC 100877]